MSVESNLRAYALKYKLIQLCGGKCVKCGYDKLEFTAAFDFHHRDPLTKSFQINKAIEHGKSWNDILNEAAKCDLLCAICHRLEHFKKPDINVEEYFEKMRNRKQRPDLPNRTGRPTKEELENLLKTCSKSHIAKIYSVHNSTVNSWCNKYAIVFDEESKFKRQNRTNVQNQRPSKEELSKLLMTLSAVKIGRIYGVSDKAVKKWMIKFGIENPNSKKFNKINW